MSQEPPVGEKHHKRPHNNQSVGHNCISCCSASDNKSRPFQHMTYGRNDMLADILHGQNLMGGAIICLRCHNKLIQNMFVSCCICENVVKCKSTLIFKRSQYSTDGILLQSGKHTPGSLQYICKVCHSHLQPTYMCVCRKRYIEHKKRKIYEKGNYDFTKFVVSRCFNNITYPQGEQPHICLSGDK